VNERSQQACEAMSHALFSEDADPLTDDAELNVSAKDKQTKLKNEMIPGADTPMTLFVANSTQGAESKRPLRALVDTGAKKTFAHLSALPPGATTTVLDAPTRATLLDKSTAMLEKATLSDTVLPELSTTAHITKPFTACVADAVSPTFDVILGQDFNVPVGLDAINSEKIIKWGEHVTPHRVVPVKTEKFQRIQQAHVEACSPSEDDIEPANLMAVEMLAAKHEAADVNLVADNQKHLTSEQREELKQLLRQFPELFGNELKACPHKKVHLELKEDVKPSCKRHCPVAHAHLKLFKDELERLCKTGVLKRTGASEWASPSFITPKKDQTIRWISDLRELNKAAKRKMCPLPKIADVLRRRNGCAFFTKLDVSMQHCTFKLDDASKKLCTISTPFGNCECQRLPMGCCQSTDFAQEVMESVLQDIQDIEACLDDVGVFNKDWASHLKVLEVVLTRLEANNFVINPLKCEWGAQETDFLGHWMTPTATQPWKKKVEAILRLDAPRNIKDVRSFVGAVNFYRDMYPKRSHVLAPLHALTGLKSNADFEWTDVHQKAFDAMKAIMVKDAYIRYPDHNEPFHVYADASDLQLGAAIMQNGHPIAFHSRKLNTAQKNCTVTTIEKELLSIVETLREFRTMLCGCKELHVHTDHKNLTCTNLNSQRVIRWRLFIEEFNAQFHCIKGPDNAFADALSRLPLKQEQTADSVPVAKTEQSSVECCGDDHSILHTEIFETMDDEIVECLLNFPEVDEDNPFALDLDVIAKEQQNDAILQQFKEHRPDKCRTREVGRGKELNECFDQKDSEPLICVLDSMLETIINFCHAALGHMGIARLTKAQNNTSLIEMLTMP